jgi:hypothetical protein
MNKDDSITNEVITLFDHIHISPVKKTSINERILKMKKLQKD